MPSLNELMMRDAEMAKKFYADTVGWSFEAMPMPDGTYWVAKMGNDYVSGLFPLTSPQFDGVPEGWMAYLAVDNVDARVKKAQAAGAPARASDFRCAGRRPHRHPARARPHRHRLDDASATLSACDPRRTRYATHDRIGG